MTIRVALNGIERLNRLTLRAISEGGFADLFEVVAVVGPGTPAGIAQLLSLDTRYGAASTVIEAGEDGLLVSGSKIALVSPVKTGKLPWKDMEVDLVIEAGSGSAPESRKRHLTSGAKKVVVTSGAGDVDAVIVGGVNETSYDPDKHHTVSTGPAWLNCCGPVLRALQEGVGIRSGGLTFVSAIDDEDCQDDRIDADGRLVRSPFRALTSDVDVDGDLLESLLPRLKERISLQAFKSPAETTSIMTLNAVLERPAPVDELRSILTGAAESDEMAGILGVADQDPLASLFRRDPRSSVVDLGSVRSHGGEYLSLAAWYDQEWALACRVAELTSLICEAGVPGTA